MINRGLQRLARVLPPPLSWLAKSAMKRPWALLVLCAVGVVWYAGEVKSRAAMSWQGVPVASSWQDWRSVHRVLRNDHFLVGWSDIRMTPLWVEYRLKATNPRYHLKRPEGFHRDWRSGLPLTSSLYDASGYDRGHMAPNYAMASLYGKRAQQQTFLMTNVAPQRPALNRKLWQRLEAAVVDQMLPRFGSLWVITGPVYTANGQWLPSCLNAQHQLITLPVCVSIPQAFYKIVVVPGRQGEPAKALAFLMPQQVQGNEPLDRYLVPIATIERLTGLRFFSDLPAAQQHRLKHDVDTRGWQLERYSRLPARY
ncbi:hypothetical protein R84981_002289 [Carnimonas sp. R-84981]|uniref:DNA/RNA non-specific endonuclease n=1 Tax=Carnimonas bestiolae TaxID=3402172 RepID=UPI003EDB9A1A